MTILYRLFFMSLLLTPIIGTCQKNVQSNAIKKIKPTNLREKLGITESTTSLNINELRKFDPELADKMEVAFIREFDPELADKMEAALKNAFDDITQSNEQLLRPALIDAWIGTCVADTILLFSKKLRHAFYGTHNPPQAVIKLLKPMLENAALANSVTIKQTNSFWGWSSRIFSNHDTIFINKNLCAAIKANTISQENKDRLLGECTRYCALIKNDWDKKILISGMIIPPLVFLGTTLLNKLMHKLAHEKDEKSWLKKCAYYTHRLSESFIGKTGIALALILAQMLYLNSKISADTKQLLTDMNLNPSTPSRTWSPTNPLGW